jgi:hypothetical protein
MPDHLFFFIGLAFILMHEMDFLNDYRRRSDLWVS